MKKTKMKPNSKKLAPSKSSDSIRIALSQVPSAQSLHNVVTGPTSKTSIALNKKDLKFSANSFTINKRTFIKKKNKSGDDAATKSKDSDQSDSSNSDRPSNRGSRSNGSFTATSRCTADHAGRELLNTQLPMSAEMVFILLFSNSKLMLDFHESRNSTNLELGEWRDNNGVTRRTVRMTAAVSATVGPKNSQIVEEQVLRSCTKPGELYSIDVTITNKGIPYADSFIVALHFCIVKTAAEDSTLEVYGQILYTKPVWGFVKNLIEKNAWSGLEDYFDELLEFLRDEACALGKYECAMTGNVQRRKSEKKSDAEAVLIQAFSFMNETKDTGIWLFVALLIMFLFIFNLKLLNKISNLEKRLEFDSKLRTRMPNLYYTSEYPTSNEEWLNLMREQEIMHENELKKWHKILQTSIEMLKTTEKTLAELMYV